jgi:hypothetical protein
MAELALLPKAKREKLTFSRHYKRVSATTSYLLDLWPWRVLVVISLLFRNQINSARFCRFSCLAVAALTVRTCAESVNLIFRSHNNRVIPATTHFHNTVLI